MKYALAIALLLLTSAAQAQSRATESEVFQPLPPLEYDYPYEGKLVITRVDQFMIDRACPKPTRQGTKILGCAYLGKNENGEDQCWLIIANDKIIEGWHWVYETVFRHEQGHCNGWPNDHPNARSKMAPPGSKPVNMTVRPSEADLEGTGPFPTLLAPFESASGPF